MATKQGRVKETFEIDDKASGKLKRIRGAHGELNQEVGKTTSVFQKGRSAFTGFAQTAGVVTTAVTGLAVAGFGSLAKEAISGANALQQNALALEVMLGSQEKSRELLQDISQFASKTPFNLTDLQGYTKQLIAFNFGAQDIIPTMNTLGNIASGVGTDKLPNLIYAFGQVRVAGRLMGQDLNQFINAGVPIIEELANVLGVSNSEVKKLVEQGAISFDHVQQALENLGGEQGRWGDMMDKQSKTLGGMISNAGDLRDSLFRLAGGIREDGSIIEGGLLDTVSDGMTFLLGFIEENRDTITGFFEQVGKYAGGALNVIGGLIFAFAEGDAMNDTFAKGLETFGLSSETITNVLGKVQTFVDFIANNTDSIQFFLKVMGGFLALGGIVGVITMIVNAINPVFLVIAGLAVAITLLKKAWDDNLGGIRDIVIDKVLPALSNFFNIVTTNLTKFRETIGNVISSAPVQLFISTMRDTFINIFSKIGDLILMFREKIMVLIPKIQEWYEKLKPLINIFMTIQKVIFIVQAVIVGVLIVAIYKFIEVIYTVLAPVLSFLIDAFIFTIDIIVNAIALFVTGVQLYLTTFVTIWTNIFNFAKGVVFGFRDGVVTGITNLKNKFSEIFNSIKTIALGIWGGIKDGIKSGINGVIDIINNFIRNVNSTLSKLDEYGSKIGINVDFRLGEVPKLNVGTNYVPEDQLAFIHKGEAVVPADKNPYNPNARTPDGNIVNNDNKKEVKMTNNFYNYETDYNSATSKIAFQIKYA